MKRTSPLFYIGTILLLVAVAASVILSGTKLGLFDSIPGCGVGSGCDSVTGGPWGTVMGVPVSFIGFGWFFGLFVGWVTSGGLSKKFLWSVRLGALASVGFIAVMVSIGSFCKWCALAHLCNILFWIICEFGVPKSCNHSKTQEVVSEGGVVEKDVVVLWISFFVATIALVLIGVGVKVGNKERSKENIEQITSGVTDQSTLALLEGGHRIGSPDAPIQVVMFTDYQCPDCKRIEGNLERIMKTRNDISVVVKHFPLNYDCNDMIGKFKIHGNACWAARAAEAAALVGGQGAWETMHHWLFSQGGRFTDKDFAKSLVSLGFDAQQIIAVMMGDETLQRVKDNAVDGKALGVYFTPMVFINGVEYLWYYGGEGSRQNTIDLVAASIRSGNSTMTTPPTAKNKLVEDWRRGRTFNLPGHEGLSWLGDGPIEFVVWGDYQAQISGELDGEIQRFINDDNARIKYSFRHFPVDESCNGGVDNMSTKYDGSCMLSKLVEAVNLLAGSEERWAMHDWILSQSNPVDLDEAIQRAVIFSGVDEGVIQDVLSSIEVNNRMRMDVLSKNNVWRKSIPVLMIDNRFVPRWKSDDVTANELFHRIVEEVDTEGTSR